MTEPRMNSARESWIWFWRDLRHGELTLLLVALIVAVAATTSLRFFSSGLDKRLQQDAARLIAGDLVIRSSRPIPVDFVSAAQGRKLAIAHTLEFSSVLVNKGEFQLAQVKAVSAAYPLRGEMRVATATALLKKENTAQPPAATVREKIVRRIPAPGTVWLDQRLIVLLKASVGDSIQLGEKNFRIAEIITYEPGQSGFPGFSPRALMNRDDVAGTGIIQPGSRLNYQLLTSGNEAAVDAYRRWVKPKLGVSMRLLDVNEGRPEISTPLARSQSYFSLATIVAVILSGLAIITSARRFAERHFDMLALMRCVGASRRESLQRLLGEIFWVWLFAILLGAALGLLASQLLSHVLSGLLPGGTPLLSLVHPLLTGIATATLTLAGFALPALAELGRVTPLRVLRRELLPPSWSLLATLAMAWLALMLLLMLETGQTVLTLIVMAGGSVLVALAYGGLVWLLGKSRHRFSNPAVLAVVRDPAGSSKQILGLALGLTALLLVVSLRGELMEAWLKKLPADAPNQFALNIAPDERKPLLDFLEKNHVSASAPFAIVRARLTLINGKPVQTAVSKEKESDRDESLNRELNLTWSKNLPKGNTLTSGQWWQAGAKTAPVSVEEKLAKRLGITLGDTLVFTLAEGELRASVASVRHVDWDSFQPNFYFVFPPAALDAFPASYLTSFHLPPEQRDVLNTLVRTFPTVILIDVASIMGQIRQILDQLSHAIEAVLVFVLAGGMLVIWAQVIANLDSRRFEAALLRVAGISRRQLQQRLLGEFLLLGALAGVIAAALNEILAAVIYWNILDLAPVLHPTLWWQAPLTGALLVVMAGLPGARQAWAVSPMLVLRKS
ncbi:MAG: ABC transporter permease [bacterium]|nr:ABC transporter permease [bacterium]